MIATRMTAPRTAPTIAVVEIAFPLLCWSSISEAVVNVDVSVTVACAVGLASDRVNSKSDTIARIDAVDIGIASSVVGVGDNDTFGVNAKFSQITSPRQCHEVVTYM